MTDQDSRDAFGLLRSFIAHRAYLDEGLGLVAADIKVKRAGLRDVFQGRER